MKIIGATYGNPHSTFTYSGVPYSLFSQLETRKLLVDRINIKITKPSDIFRNLLDINRSIAYLRPKKNKYWRYLPKTIECLSQRIQKRLSSYPEHDTIIQIGVGGLPQISKTLFAHIEISIKTAANLNGFSTTYGFSQSQGKYLNKAIQGEKQFMNACDVIWTNSDWTYETLKHHNIPKSKFFIHPPVANINDPGTIERNWDIPHIVFIGKDWVRKNGPQLVLAFKSLQKSFPKSKLTIIGCNPDIQQEEGIQLLGYLDKSIPSQNEAIVQALRSANLFCMPSEWESTGIVYMEAALHGLPLMMVKGQGREFIFSEKYTHFLENSESDNIAQALISHYSNKQRAQAMGHEAREYSLNNFQWSGLTDKIINRIKEAKDQEPTKTPIRT